ncbi:MAG: peptidoglycan-binding domain-containing protein [Candidatus Acidiferrales bacterium]
MRWIAIVASLFVACTVLYAAPVTRKRARHGRATSSAHASYHPVRYTQESRSKKTTHRRTHHYRRVRHYRRRRYYHHRVRLPRGPSPERITQIQSALARGGYYKGDPNGKWNSDTVAALQKFQSAHNIDASGKLDAPTLQKLGLGSDIAGVAAPRTVVPKSCCSTGPAVANPAAPAKIPANSTSSASAASPRPSAAKSPKPAAASTSTTSEAAIAPTVNPSTSGTSSPASATKPDAAQQ